MIYTEERKNLFEVDKNYFLAHCIAEDAVMGAGIAVTFVKNFPALKNLRGENLQSGTCILVDRVFNLITKRRSSGKPTYESLTASLKDCKNQCEDGDIKYLAIPKIGCGLDRLQWPKVREIIKEIFQDLDIEIKVCRL